MSIFSNETQEDEEQMNISQEILVLDFGDEKSDFLRAEADFGKGKFYFYFKIDSLILFYLFH